MVETSYLARIVVFAAHPMGPALGQNQEAMAHGGIPRTQNSILTTSDIHGVKKSDRTVMAKDGMICCYCALPGVPHTLNVNLS